MLICESCGAVFNFPASQMDNETGCVESFCPECHSKYIMNAVPCQVCGDWVAEDDAFGYSGSTVCEECLNAAGSDLDLLYAATKDEREEFDLPMLFSTFYSDEEILDILYNDLKQSHNVIPLDTKSFVRRYANEIADEIVKEAENEKK